MHVVIKMEEEKEEKKHHEHIEHHHGHDSAVFKEEKKNLARIDMILIVLGIILGIVLIVNVFQTLDINQFVNKNIKESMEKSRPAKIELYTIKDGKCADCYDLSSVAASLKSAKINVTKEETLDYASIGAKALIAQYGIDKIPAVIIKGEIDKINAQGLQKKDDALVITSPQSPYTNPKDGTIIGRVSATIFSDPTCKKCTNLSNLLLQIKAAGVRIAKETAVDSNSQEGKDLAKKYSLDHAPTILLSKDASAYQIVQESWPTIGTIEKDGSYVLRVVTPPYINLSDKKIRGLVNIIYLDDKSCATCYDVNLHKQILGPKGTFGLAIESEENTDISDAKGKELISKYSINLVPTVIITGDVAVYPSVGQLKQFFSAEKDGSFVFRQPMLLGAYKDLKNNSVITPTQGQ